MGEPTFRSTGGCSSLLSQQAMKLVGCVGNAPTLVPEDIRFTGGSRSLRGYQPLKWLRDVACPRGCASQGRGALTA